MNTYEIQVYKNGQWQFGSYFDDRADAVSEARNILASSRYAGVRVVQEDYDQDTNKATNSVVFSRLDKSDYDAKSSPAKSSPAKAAPRKELVAAPSSGKIPRAATSSGGMARMVMSLVLVIAAGIAVMVGIQFYN